MNANGPTSLVQFLIDQRTTKRRSLHVHSYKLTDSDYDVMMTVTFSHPMREETIFCY